MSRRDDPDLAARLNRAKEVVGGPTALARATGIPKSTLGYYLAGTHQPRVSELVAIGRAADLSVEWLATGEEPALVMHESELAEIITYVLELKGFGVGEDLSPERLAALVAHLYVLTLERRAKGDPLSNNEQLATVRDWKEELGCCDSD